MSKVKLVELDVDIIGVQEPITKEEERAISDYISKNKSIKPKGIRKSKLSSKRKV
jgi:hypothetical protein